MYTQFNYFCTALVKRFMAMSVTCIVMGFGAVSAQAITINFDDVTRLPSDLFPCFCDHPVTDEWLSQGLLIDGGFLVEYEGPNVISSPNALLGGNYLSLQFVGALPTFVSMYVTSQRGDVVYLYAQGPAGFTDGKQTTGWAGPDNDTPAVPNQYISFTSATGISSISIWSFYGSRTSALIDDLTLEYTAVPEPASFGLWAIALFGFYLRKFKTTQYVINDKIIA